MIRFKRPRKSPMTSSLRLSSLVFPLSPMIWIYWLVTLPRELTWHIHIPPKKWQWPIWRWWFWRWFFPIFPVWDGYVNFFLEGNQMFKVTKKQLEMGKWKKYIYAFWTCPFRNFCLPFPPLLFFQQAMQLMQTNPDEARRRWRVTVEWKMFTLPPQNGSMKNRDPSNRMVVTFQISRHDFCWLNKLWCCSRCKCFCWARKSLSKKRTFAGKKLWRSSCRRLDLRFFKSVKFCQGQVLKVASSVQPNLETYNKSIVFDILIYIYIYTDAFVWTVFLINPSKKQQILVS